MTGSVDPELHQDKGGRGFPYFAALNADGEVLAKRQRFVHDATQLANLMAQATANAALLAQHTAAAVTGDHVGRAECFFLRYKLGHLDDQAAKARADELLAHIPTSRPVLRRKVTGVRSDICVRELLPINDATAAAAAGSVFAAMHSANQTPSDPQCRHYFWTHLITHARSHSDATLLEQAITKYKDWLQIVAPADLGLRRYITTQEQFLAQLQQGQAPTASGN